MKAAVDGQTGPAHKVGIVSAAGCVVAEEDADVCLITLVSTVLTGRMPLTVSRATMITATAAPLAEGHTKRPRSSRLA